MSDVVWDPIATYVQKLGAKVENYAMVTDFRYTGRRITGLVIAKPDGAGHHDGATAWTTSELPRDGEVHLYDAFDDVKGRQSFTAAILDDNGDGIVITSLHSRSEARTLLKGVTDGAGDGLSPEEQQAVDAANGKRG